MFGKEERDRRAAAEASTGNDRSVGEVLEGDGYAAVPTWPGSLAKAAAAGWKAGVHRG